MFTDQCLGTKAEALQENLVHFLWCIHTMATIQNTQNTMDTISRERSRQFFTHIETVDTLARRTKRWLCNWCVAYHMSLSQSKKDGLKDQQLPYTIQYGPAKLTSGPEICY